MLGLAVTNGTGFPPCIRPSSSAFPYCSATGSPRPWSGACRSLGGGSGAGRSGRRAQVRRCFLESRSPDARREGPRPRAGLGPAPAPCVARDRVPSRSASQLPGHSPCQPALPCPHRARLQPLLPTIPPLRPAPCNCSSLPTLCSSSPACT